MSHEQWFWLQVNFDPDACWTWTGYCNAAGYGHVRWGEDRRVFAHRVAWEAVHGPIPDGLVVCHHCDNPPCVRPDHLFLGTVRDNAQDMIAKGRSAGQKQTHCKHGHPFTLENTYRDPKNGYRQCRICRLYAARRSATRKRSVPVA